ncbi:MAG: methyltransferase domain-containing protein, partial [Verrucomicrobia bacterium]|nr:methyltransferase domain-containing protein [Verrucomicrobiota bacterium]
MIDRQAFYEKRAAFRPRESERCYHRLLKSYFAFFIPPNSQVLEVGCGLGDLLAAVQPKSGLGIDFSPAMIDLARERHPQLQFDVGEASSFSVDQSFDYIVLSDLVNDLPDVQAVLTHLGRFARSETRLIVNFFNYLWHPVLRSAERLGLKAPTLPQNWLSMADFKNLLHLSGWEVIRTDTRILWPIRTPVLEPLLNRWLAPVLGHLCMTVILVARPKPQVPAEQQYSCTVVIPARNEAGNIEAAVQRTPEMGLGTELVFVEGHSTDNTWDEIRRVAAKYPHRWIRILKQHSKGKGGAVREAFAAATADLL